MIITHTVTFACPRYCSEHLLILTLPASRPTPLVTLGHTVSLTALEITMLQRPTEHRVNRLNPFPFQRWNLANIEECAFVSLGRQMTLV